MDNENKKITSKALRILFVVLAFVCLMLGILGTVVPVLPTTPFLLLAAFLFSKSSDRIHNWLINHKILGSIIRDYNKYKGIRMKYKVISVIMIIISAVFCFITIPFLAIKILTVLILFIIAIILITKFKTLA